MRSVVEIVTPAASELLTTLARVKAELQIATADSDEILEAKIAEASSDIQAAVGKRLPREEVKETFWHDDALHALLTRAALRQSGSDDALSEAYAGQQDRERHGR